MLMGHRAVLAKNAANSVPATTIESILVTPLKGSPVSQLSIDQTKFEKRSGEHRPEDVVALLGDRTRTGYIVAYAGKRATVNEAKKWVENAKNYLVTVRGLSAAQITVIDGGFRKGPTRELYIVEPNLCPPLPSPSVDPRDVQIVTAGRSKNKRRSLRPINDEM
jgi:hypothetical protein